MDAMAVDVFMSCRPEYSRDHVADLQQAMSERGIPFCFACADWHDVGEEHSGS